MDIKSIASSSAGNCYIVDDIMLDAGALPAPAILKNVKHCLISHAHADHCGCLPAVLKAGIECWGSLEFIATQKPHHRLRATSGALLCGDYFIQCIELMHDAPNQGYVLHNMKSDEKLLYATDTAWIPYKIGGLTHLLIECNYSELILQRRVYMQETDPAGAARVTLNHMSIESLEKWLAEHDLSKLKEVHLIHLSDGNSDEKDFIRRIQGITGCIVKASKKNSKGENQ